jgi:demethylspheroidene O-methyltransferase
MSLLGCIHGVRDRLLKSPEFQRFLASFWLTRPIARAEARAVFDICAGFVYSQVLSACIRLGLFKILATGAKTITQLSRELALPEAATKRLLLAAVSLRLVARRGADRFGLGMLGAALNGNPGIAAMIEHHAMLYRDLEDPVALLRGQRTHSELAEYWSYSKAERPAQLELNAVAKYSALMAVSQSFIAPDVLDAYPFDRHRCVLDVGGGVGAFIACAARRFPHLRFMLFDLPSVAGRGLELLTSAGLGSRVEVTHGNFLSDALPHGADLVSLVRVLHDHDDASVKILLGAVREALTEHGTILIAEPMSGVHGAEPVGDAYFGMYLLAMGRGRPRTPHEIGCLLSEAGFTKIRRQRTRRPMLVSIVTAKQP